MTCLTFSDLYRVEHYTAVRGISSFKKILLYSTSMPTRWRVILQSYTTYLPSHWYAVRLVAFSANFLFFWNVNVIAKNMQHSTLSSSKMKRRISSSIYMSLPRSPLHHVSPLSSVQEHRAQKKQFDWNLTNLHKKTLSTNIKLKTFFQGFKKSISI